MGTLLLILMVILYIVCCVVLIVVVLAQEGKGGGISGLISGGSALGDTFGASGGESFYRTWTRNAAIVFLAFSFLITLTAKTVYENSGKSAVNEAATNVKQSAEDAKEKQRLLELEKELKEKTENKDKTTTP